MAYGGGAGAKQYESLYKIVLVGDFDVGKQEIIKRFVDNTYQGKYVTTVAVDLTVKLIELDGKKIKLQLWDTVGNDRYRSLTTAYFRGAQGVMIVYDVTKERSFNSLTEWYRQIEEYACPEVVTMVIGNRCDLDLQREVSKERGQQAASQLGLKFFEVSPKTGENVAEAILSLVRDVRGQFDEKAGREGKSKNRASSITLGDRQYSAAPKEGSGFCC